jgi:pilus assembly protein Flp/PilA
VLTREFPTPSASYEFATFVSGGNLNRLLAVDLPMFKQFSAILRAIAFLKPRSIRLRNLLSNLVRDESGVTAIEYALIAALIAVAAIAAFTLVGTNLSTVFSTIAGKV